MRFDNTLLKHLVPIRQLQTEHRLQIADKAELFQLRAGDELSANEEGGSFIYLIEGRLDLLEINKPAELLDSADGRAYHPLFSEEGGKKRLIAQTGCIIVRFNKQLFHDFVDEELISGGDSETFEMSEVEANLFNEIMRAFNAGELKLPSLPDIAIKIKKALADPNISEEDMVRIVAADPAIAIRLVSAADGLMARGADPICSIRNSISQLGMQTSKDLISKSALNNLFSSKSEMLNQRMHELYDHSIDIAALSFALAKQSAMLSPDHVLLAGLAHEIGVIPILNYIEETGLIINDEAELDSIINNLKAVVGSMVIRNWGLPVDLVTVVEDFENWQRYEEGEVDTCDIVIVAQIYRRLKHHQLDGLPKMDQVPAFKKLYPINQDADFAKKVFQQAHEDSALIMQLLKM